MEERAELFFPDQRGQLIVSGEVCGRQTGERGGIEGWLLADGGHQLPGPIDEQGAAGIRFVEEVVEYLLDPLRIAGPE